MKSSKQTIENTVLETERFLKSIKELVEELKVNNGNLYNVSPKIRGQVKRDSMSLTRQLAEYRRITIYGDLYGK